MTAPHPMPAPGVVPLAEPLLELVDRRQAIALLAWLRARGSGPLPHRRALKPEGIAAALPVAALVGVDWSAERPSYRARIEGRWVAAAFGEARGRSFRQTFKPTHLGHVLPAFDRAAKGEVGFSPMASKTSDGRDFIYSRLLLPWKGDSGRVSRILAVFGFDTDRLALLGGPLDVGDVIPAASVRRHMAGHLRLQSA